ncbi:MAG: hypothetical protein AMJ53_06650 [Gammaproteobacteria bacterium SG8_11]|nr:MAG: hypothetical protein AMJ53_06650 [Gammaproteobacteria bacterium SG8_11]
MNNFLSTKLHYSDQNTWKALASRAQVDDVYFSPEYLKINESILGGESECFIYEDDNLIAYYAYIKRPIEGTNLFDIVSPYGFGGFIINNKDSAVRFDNAFRTHCVESGIVSEFIRFHPFFNNHVYPELKSLEVQLHQAVVQVDYTQPNFDLNHTVNKEVRKKIRKAQNNQLQVVEDSHHQYYKDFIQLYHQTMDSKQAAQFYFFDERFFSDLQTYLENSALLLAAIYNEQLIGGLLILFGDNYAYNFLSCSDPRYLALGTNDLLQYCALDWAYKNGKKKYLLGGGLKGEDSLFKYKARFSSGRSDFYIGRRIHLLEAYDDLCRQRIQQQNTNPTEFYTRSWFPLYRSES